MNNFGVHAAKHSSNNSLNLLKVLESVTIGIPKKLLTYVARSPPVVRLPGIGKAHIDNFKFRLLKD